MGTIHFRSMLLTYALAFFYGGYLVRDGTMNVGEVITVLIALMIGASGLGQAMPHFAAIVSGRAAAVDVFKVIDTPSTIDNEKGQQLTTPLQGKVELKHVDFSYPTRSDEIALSDASIIANPGETIALVGPSGSGLLPLQILFLVSCYSVCLSLSFLLFFSFFHFSSVYTRFFPHNRQKYDCLFVRTLLSTQEWTN